MKFAVNKKLVFTISLLLFTYFSFCQEYRNSGFSKPMNLPFNLAGSFGEPRKDHFHSGIDIKTNGVEGEPVFAIGDGYISRIKVSPYGYGKVIYITHTNGFTSVYAHLSTFYGAIEKYIHSQHYVQQKSELDLTLDATIFPVKQKDTIAFSGNTGGSTAPHLHFEIRNTKTEHALNPLDFYPKEFYVDTIPPQINKVKINSIYSDIYSSFSQYYFLKKVNNNLNAIDSIIIENDTLVSFSFEGFDKQDNSENKNGIKKMIIFQENRLGFKYDLTEIDFDKTRMCNAFVDYHEMMNDSGYFYNGYQLPGNKLNYYSVGNGTFPLKNGRNEFYITCYDYNENEIKINLTVFKRDADVMVDTAAAYNPDEIYGDISINKNDSIPLKNFKINLSANTFYDNNFLSIEKSTKGRIEQYLVSNFALTIPLQKPAKIEFKSSIKKNRNKIVVVRQNHKGNETALKTTFDKNKFYAETKELGSFYLKYDTTKPTVEILNLKSEIINIKITDNLSSINTYNGYVDNKWVNFYYDAKNDVIQYNFDEYCSKGEHLLKIIVTDIVGNKTMIQQKFNY